MTNHTTAFTHRRKHPSSFLSHGSYASKLIGLGASMAFFRQANGFIHHPHRATTSSGPIRHQHKQHESLTFLKSTRSERSINATSIPFFVDPISDEETTTSSPSHHLPKEIPLVDDEESAVFPGLLKLASMHCASQALNTAVRLKLPDILGNQQMTVDEIADSIEASTNNDNSVEDEFLPCHRDALFRTLRLLATVDVVNEERISNIASVPASMESSVRFSLTPLGKSLRTKTDSQEPSMGSAVLHWMEEPLWDSWLEVPDYIAEGGFEDANDTLLPFDRANGAVSSDDYYNQDDHPESLKRANDFVKLIDNHELKAVVKGFDWSLYKGHRLVDIAGNNGKLAEAIAAHEPSLECSCFDIPKVISSIPSGQEPDRVTLVPGNVLDSSTIPDCEVILMRHFCDRCKWFDDQTVEILRSCKQALDRSSFSKPDSNVARKIIIADAVLPDCGSVDASNDLPLYLDAMYMLVGRERQRTKSEWTALARTAGLELAEVVDTGVPSCSLIVLEPVAEEAFA